MKSRNNTFFFFIFRWFQRIFFFVFQRVILFFDCCFVYTFLSSIKDNWDDSWQRWITTFSVLPTELATVVKFKTELKKITESFYQNKSFLGDFFFSNIFLCAPPSKKISEFRIISRESFSPNNGTLMIYRTREMTRKRASPSQVLGPVMRQRYTTYRHIHGLGIFPRGGEKEVPHPKIFGL